jgi:tetratricopeptide (TPR) repeat protein
MTHSTLERKKNGQMAAKVRSTEEILSRSRELIQLNDHRQAYKLCRKAMSSASPHPDLYLVCATSAYYIGKTSEAVKILRKAVRLWPDMPDPLFNLGYILNFAAQPYDALGPLMRLVDIEPAYPGAQTNLAVAFLATGQFELAKETCLEAIDHAANSPDLAELYNLLGSIYRELEMNELSEEAFRKALEANPEYADALGNLAMMLEESSQIEAAIKASQDGLLRFPENHQFSLVLAKCERRLGKSQQSIERLSKINLDSLAAEIKAAILYELGRQYDRQEISQKAFDYFSLANDVTAKLIPKNVNKGHFPKILKASSKFYSRNDFLRRETVENDTPLTPCFLIGFPRSGTTLLELSLAGHPDVAVMEEVPLVGELYSSTIAEEPLYPKILSELGDSKIRELRRQYFERAGQYAELKDKSILINKHPLDTVYIPVIQTIFPEAKIIFSARHPVDVCLSCWMQEFKMNHSNANFLTLQETANYYSLCMDLWMYFQSDVDMNYLIVSYEDVVEDHENTARKVIQFLGLEWISSVLDHIGTAKSLPRVNTASYHQVTEPIYSRSMYRWERYRDQLASILPKLQKYVEHFGYKM